MKATEKELKYLNRSIKELPTKELDSAHRTQPLSTNTTSPNSKSKESAVSDYYLI